MKHFYLAVTVMALLQSPLAGQNIVGVWRPVEVITASGQYAGRHTSDVQPGLLIFTDRHYSVQLVTDFAARPKLSENPTLEERARVYLPYTANSGTYEIVNGVMTQTPIVAKNPANMDGRSFKTGVKRDGSTLWLIAKGPDGAETQRIRYELVESPTSTKASPASTKASPGTRGKFDPQLLEGTWERVLNKNVKTAQVDSMINYRRDLITYANGYAIYVYNTNDRTVVAPEVFAKLTAAEKDKARLARLWNSQKNRPAFGGGASRYTSDGNTITYKYEVQTDPYNVGRTVDETILQLDDQILVVRQSHNAQGELIDETWRRVN